MGSLKQEAETFDKHYHSDTVSSSTPNQPGSYHVGGSSNENIDNETLEENLPVATQVCTIDMGEEVIIEDAQIIHESKRKSKPWIMALISVPLVVLLALLVYMLNRKSFPERIKEILIPVSGIEAFEDTSSRQYLTWRTMSAQLMARENHNEFLEKPLHIIDRYLSILIPVSTFSEYLWSPRGERYDTCEVFPCNDEGFVSVIILKNNRVGNFGGGIIATEVGQLRGLTDLILTRNALQSSIPTEIGDLEHLRVLDLRGNNLRGKIPSEIGKLQNLEWLFLDNNELEGTIPTEFGNLNSLIYADLSNNALSGAIPSEMAQTISLGGVSLKENNITGNVDFMCEKNFTNELYFHETITWNFVVEHNYSYAVELGLVVDCVDGEPVVHCSCCICG